MVRKIFAVNQNPHGNLQNRAKIHGIPTSRAEQVGPMRAKQWRFEDQETEENN